MLFSTYSFGTKTAEFHVCSRCGIVPVVTSAIEGSCLRGCECRNAFDNVDLSSS